MNKIYTLIIISLIFTSCGPNKEYWDISKFKIDNNALKDNEEIKLIYTSQSPDNHNDLTYYIHFIAISQVTNDTVNILSTANFAVKKEDGDKIFNFFDKDNLASKITQMDLTNLNRLSDLDKIENNEPKAFKQVLRNPKFDFIADNNYPTIMGSIGIMTDDKK